VKAVWYESQGPADEVLVLGDMPAPEPGPGEVAVAIHASGVHPSDVKTRRGYRGPMAFARQIPHSDGAGVIKAVGAGVDKARVGERVWVHSAAYKRAGGTAAEICVLPAEFAHPLPDAISFAAGAALGIPAMTAHRALFCAVGIGNGGVGDKTVLVTGGAGAVGHSAIQLARWAGARAVIATVSSPEKAEAAIEAGADHVIDYTRQDVIEAIRGATKGAGVDHIVEVEFGGNLPVSLEVLKPQGVLACYGSEKKPRPALDFYPLMFRNVRLQTIFMYELTPDQRRNAVADITHAIEAGAFTPLIDSSFALEDTAAAHARVESGRTTGTVVVTPSGQ
jgi:NADPH2:quinone reductase